MKTLCSDKFLKYFDLDKKLYLETDAGGIYGHRNTLSQFTQQKQDMQTLKVFLNECASLAGWISHIFTLLNGLWGMPRHKVMMPDK